MHAPALSALRGVADVIEVASIDQAIEMLRSDQFSSIFSDAGDFLPLERALVSQQASLVLNTIGEGVCIVDQEGRVSWMNRRMQTWPLKLLDQVRNVCREAFVFFTQTPAEEKSQALRNKRYALAVDDQQFWDIVVSPVLNPTGRVVQVVAVAWESTASRRMQQKIDAIDKAGRELVRIESDLTKLNVTQRLSVLENKIVRYVRDLMHYDHFAIRLLDRRSNKLEVVISTGLPPEALSVELFAHPEGNGISGYVAATGRSYICHDTERDSRYISGLADARSSLTVPLQLHDKVIGIFNVESHQVGAFSEDDRQFAEIFARYVAVALNILDLLVVERVSTRSKVAESFCSEVAGPLNDIASDASALIEDFIGHDDLRRKLQQILDNVVLIRKGLNQAAQGPKTLLGADEVQVEDDPILRGARVLVADDELNIRTTIQDVFRKFQVRVSIASGGAEAIRLLEEHEFDLIVSDIRMPDKSGYDIFAAARKKSLSLPVILMTGFGYDPNHSIVRASQEGLHAVLFKPFKVAQLLTEVRRALQPRATPRQEGASPHPARS
jgi:CheY-like chemotaxis protein